jgi:hypothetical protein
MNSPTIESVGEDLKFHWPNEGVVVAVERCRENGSRGASAELTVMVAHNGHGVDRVLTSCGINLAAIRTRTEVANRLEKLHPSVDWDYVVETVAVSTTRRMRQGAPVVLLTDDIPTKPVGFRCAPLVHEAMPSVLFGPGGLGKSLVALMMAMAVETGGWHGKFCGVPGKTLYLDYESEKEDLAHRAKQLRLGHPGLMSAQPSYRRSHVPIADDLPALRRIVDENDIRLVVIDSLAAACGAELERAETATRFYSALRSLRVSSLIIAHVAKNSDEKSIYGSVFFSNFARSTWEIRKEQEAGEDAITRIGLYHRKSNLGPLQRPFGLTMTFTDAITIEPADLSECPDLVQGLPVRERLQQALRQGHRTAKELAVETGVPLAQVKARLSEGSKTWCISLNRELWGLRDR